jgi:Rhodopirellula transposase DDE domain
LSRVRGKPACSVLRGPRRSNAPGLPGELVGEFSNGGVEWHPKGEPTRTKTHDFVDKELGRAVPYGVYDLAHDEGWVSVGDTADTSAFAVEAIRRWWSSMGKPRFPAATKLLITADAGGSNGYRVKLWKVELAKLAQETGSRTRPRPKGSRPGPKKISTTTRPAPRSAPPNSLPFPSCRTSSTATGTTRLRNQSIGGPLVSLAFQGRCAAAIAN